MTITDIQSLRELYGLPGERASKKELAVLDRHMTDFVALSPFLVVSSYSAEGTVDASPRGGQPGWVTVLSENEVLIPDFKGNNRLDTLTNIVETGRIGLLFLIPGVNETLRINGKAVITLDSQYLEQCTYQNHPPKTCILVTVEQAFLHCAKALMRSQLWEVGMQVERSVLPTMGQMLRDQIGGNTPLETQEAMEARYRKDL
ncbi:MAG TPA: phosphohydrolase [Cytophagales bacterium]|nr:phosphohydrolase [Cytophagales bacterium]HAA22891.1 phosphohydrolase [Cytophagales bacterium]HAP60559.1 phosphohydrolase [Cytophagales bacterium]